MRYSDLEYLSKFLIDPDLDDIASYEDWEESVSPELLVNDDTLDAGDILLDDITDR